MNVANGFGEDLDLARRCRQNAPGAFEALYRSQAPRLFGLAVRMVGREDAEDMVQEIFVTAHRKLDQYRGGASLGTWLFRMGTNVCLDHLRSRAHRQGRASELLEDDVAAAAEAGPIRGVVDRLDLDRAIQALPAGTRAIFVLHDVEGLGHAEIASLMGVAEGTSKSQLHKARLKLRQALSAAARVERLA